jgi:hypothetical protein
LERGCRYDYFVGALHRTDEDNGEWHGYDYGERPGRNRYGHGYATDAAGDFADDGHGGVGRDATVFGFECDVLERGCGIDYFDWALYSARSDDGFRYRYSDGQRTWWNRERDRDAAISFAGDPDVESHGATAWLFHRDDYRQRFYAAIDCDPWRNSADYYCTDGGIAVCSGIRAGHRLTQPSGG